MEHRLDQAIKEKQIGGDESSSASQEDEDMQHRLNVAKLEDRFYEENDEDEESDEPIEMDRCGRFRQAYQVALATDTQGYCVSQGNTQKSQERTPQELTAISWASFCTEILPEVDATYRIQALDSENAFDRLKLASQMLREKKAMLKSKMEKHDIKFGGE